MVSHMDRDVGRLFALLDELKLDEKTLVIFTSDNGPHQEGGHKHEFFNSNGPLKGFKRSMHEGGIRVPMIARWPGKVKPGTVSDLPSAFWDFLPTACEVANVEPPQNIDGISYLPTLLGNPDQKKHDYLFWASQEGETSVGMRMEEWKLVKYRAKKSRNKKEADQPGDWRLYDLTKDIGEEKNISNENPEIVAKMKYLLEQDELLDIKTDR